MVAEIVSIPAMIMRNTFCVSPPDRSIGTTNDRTVITQINRKENVVRFVFMCEITFLKAVINICILPF